MLLHFIAYNIEGKIYSEFVVENKGICYTVTDQKGCDKCVSSQAANNCRNVGYCKIGII